MSARTDRMRPTIWSNISAPFADCRIAVEHRSRPSRRLGNPTPFVQGAQAPERIVRLDTEASRTRATPMSLGRAALSRRRATTDAQTALGRTIVALSFG